jgi:hypothetical protein
MTTAPPLPARPPWLTRPTGCASRCRHGRRRAVRRLRRHQTTAAPRRAWPAPTSTMCSTPWPSSTTAGAAPRSGTCTSPAPATTEPSPARGACSSCFTRGDRAERAERSSGDDCNDTAGSATVGASSVRRPRVEHVQAATDRMSRLAACPRGWLTPRRRSRGHAPIGQPTGHCARRLPRMRPPVDRPDPRRRHARRG